jgi:hypothetical protein
MTTETTTNPTPETDTQVFERCKRTAALGDLQFTMRGVEKRLAEFEFSEQTMAAVADMARMEQSLLDVASTKTLQNKVWTLIDRYRASFGPAVWTTKGFPTPYRRKDGRRKWVGHRSAAPQRIVRLTREQVQELIAVVRDTRMSDAPAPVKARKAKTVAPVAPVLSCPQCSDALTLAGPHAAHGVLTCARCDQMWALAPLKAKTTTPRPRLARPPVRHERDHRSDAPRTICSKCHEERPAEEFGTRTDCKTCRKLYRQTRKLAA